MPVQDALTARLQLASLMYEHGAIESCASYAASALTRDGASRGELLRDCRAARSGGVVLKAGTVYVLAAGRVVEPLGADISTELFGMLIPLVVHEGPRAAWRLKDHQAQAAFEMAVRVVGNLLGRALPPVSFQHLERIEGLSGPSLAFGFALALYLHFTGRRCEYAVLATGALAEDGSVLRVDKLKPKLDAAEAARGNKLVFVPENSLEPFSPSVTPVRTVVRAVELMFVQPTYASFRQRFVARFVDSVLLTQGTALAIALTFWVQSILTSGPPSYRLDVLVASAVTIYLYNATVMVAEPKQATWGKRMLSLKVCDEHGQRLTRKQAFWRAVCTAVSCVTLIGPLWILFNRRRQALHDKLCKTVVVVD